MIVTMLLLVFRNLYTFYNTVSMSCVYYTALREEKTSSLTSSLLSLQVLHVQCSLNTGNLLKSGGTKPSTLYLKYHRAIP